MGKHRWAETSFVSKTTDGLLEGQNANQGNGREVQDDAKI